MTSLKSKVDTKLNLLVAYPYMRKREIDFIKREKDSVRLLIDSGAFTAWKSGKPIELDDYCTFIEKLPVTPWRYFMLDVVGDPKATFENYNIMLKRGLKPIPVFTRGEDISMLEEYYKTSDVVGIGGLVATQGNRGFVKGIMQHVGKRKVHWLGFTSLPYIRAFKPYMVDSSGWEAAARFGQADLYLSEGRTTKLSRNTAATDVKSFRVRQALDQAGIIPTQLLDRKFWHGGHSGARKLSALSVVALSDHCRKEFNTQYFVSGGAGGCLAYDVLFDARKQFYERLAG